MTNGSRLVVLILCVLAHSSCTRSHEVEVISFAGERVAGELDALGSALADAQIVLLGENGHGVKEFSEWKVQLIEWLHREHGFEPVVFESGLFECDRAWRHLARMEAADALKACLRYPFEHAELLPLFELMQAKRDSEEPLAFSGMDFQATGFDSELRPVETFERWREAEEKEQITLIAQTTQSFFPVDLPNVTSHEDDPAILTSLIHPLRDRR